MERLDYTKLVDLMKGNETTKKWDVLISYDEDKLNKLLQADSTELEDALTIPPFITDMEDNWGGTEKVKFTLSLESPRLQFLSANSQQVALNCQLTGYYESVESSKKMDIPDDTTLELSVSLFNCAGQRRDNDNSTEFLPDTSNGIPQGSPKDYTVILDPGNGRGNGLCLVFHDATATITSSNKPMGMGAKAGIEDHFHNDGKALFYYLTGVSKYTPEPGNQVLEPVAFNFSITPPDTNKNIPGILSTWISVKGGAGGGQKPSGQVPLLWEPDGVNAQSPIPAGSSASIIISSYAMVNCFFKVGTVQISPCHKFTQALHADSIIN